MDANGIRTLRADWGTKDEAIGKLMDKLQGSRQIPLLAIFPALACTTSASKGCSFLAMAAKVFMAPYTPFISSCRVSIASVAVIAHQQLRLTGNDARNAQLAEVAIVAVDDKRFRADEER